MRTQLKARAAGVVLGFLGVLMAPTDARALPFEATPEGFTEYFNNVPWNSSSKFRFFNPHKCDFVKESEYSNVSCYVDYEETSSLGTRTCLSTELEYYDKGNTWKLKTRGYSTSGGIGYGAWSYTYTPGECGPWKEVSVTPEPQPEPTPPAPPSPEQPAPKTTPAADTPTFTREQIAIGGGTLFLIGSMFGAAIGFSAGKKKNPWNEV